ncbi:MULTISPECIES: LysR family transcriptional regulator [Rhodomicrobium]|uniref:LysR family transcriptional regulator n=1 Tax=Rhodomicrobium TaxID=1068 RepID=UPI000B4B1554|nr:MULTISPECIES: LysR family transcriptional regulator [Rhodomicrobium]
MALDGLSLDQLRTFIAAAEEGSFSAAGRKLNRAQSVVSQTLANLEIQLGVKLFDRTARYPSLTEHGRALLSDARAIADGMDGFKARARTFTEGLEPELSLCIDAMYPLCALTEAVGTFREAFPSVPLRVHVEVLGAVIEPVLNGSCRIGVVGTLPVVPDTLRKELLLDVPMTTVVAPKHPLASYEGIIPDAELRKHVQLVLTDRSRLTQGQSYGVYSQSNWRLADLGAKHAFLRAGLGFGHMPQFMVADDIASGRLCVIRVAIPATQSLLMPMHAVYRKDAPPGPAGRWLIHSLKRTTVAEGFAKMHALHGRDVSPPTGAASL